MNETRPILTLSMRYLRLHEQPEKFGRNMGECLYTMETSNIRWPRGISYHEMLAARRETIEMAVGRR